jgi:hypothetical protein
MGVVNTEHIAVLNGTVLVMSNDDMHLDIITAEVIFPVMSSFHYDSCASCYYYYLYIHGLGMNKLRVRY